MGLSIEYLHNGVVRQYYTDFIVKITNGKHLLVEVKGKERPQDESKKKATIAWVNAVTAHGGFGPWHFIYATDLNEIDAAVNELA